MKLRTCFPQFSGALSKTKSETIVRPARTCKDVLTTGARLAIPASLGATGTTGAPQGWTREIPPGRADMKA